MKNSLLVICCFGLLLASCGKPPAHADTFFDSLIVAQVRTLSLSRATLTKVAWIGDQKNEITIAADTINWENELGVFRLLSAFEKPAYRSTYTVRDGINDPSSNLMIRSYTSTGGTPVPEIRFYYFERFHNLKRIEAVFRENNPLYRSSRKMSIEFDDSGSQSEIRSFVIEGNQKMIGGDTVHYKIASVIEPRQQGGPDNPQRADKPLTSSAKSKL